MMKPDFDLLAKHRMPPVQHGNMPKPTSTPNPDSELLSGFNGYYILDSEGAFFTIDTTISVEYDATSDKFTPTFSVQTILCVDGKNPITFNFSESTTATFKQSGDNYVLTYTTTGSQATTVTLTFTRSGVTNGQTATVAGTLSPAVASVSSVNGYTYNNPILPARYAGKYYVQGEAPVNAMTIGSDFALHYSAYGVAPPPTGLEPVKSYTYNMNMYYFAFEDSKGNKSSLIMGTSAAAGMVSNNITNIDGNSIPRTFTSIQLNNQDVPDPLALDLNENNAEDLAGMAGYFALTSSSSGATPGAFLSVEGIYASRYTPAYPTPKVTTKYKVTVGLCFDGVHSTVRLYDTACTYDTSTTTLTIPDATHEGVHGSWSIVFAPGYAPGPAAYPHYGTLCTATVTFNPADKSASSSWTGASPLAPVPLSAFSGANMTTKSPADSDNQTEEIISEILAYNNEWLEIVSDYSILYTPPTECAAWDLSDQQQSWLEILYVPLMYIVAYQVKPETYPIADPNLMSCMLSLGTNGAHGIASINTRYVQVAPNMPPVPLLPTAVVAVPCPAAPLPAT
ncbi:hypothetical protein [Tateyamaria sp. ANG-S1]|uniref:hypothetical protein n=1 Tax=Tateyamaria sp. ANG-S1 TaxID=1577905 RepID=UPI00057CBAF0|nr:hypothetical protein [Tateyamaria sp. ANG-S1]KIC51550.1 hypothetical protein RA29_01755 [Tateyamaria sp. ANG-S1]